jgi:hypothetical protein
VSSHLGEVLNDRVPGRKIAALAVRAEGAVGGTPDVDLLTTLENGFPMGFEPIGRC